MTIVGGQIIYEEGRCTRVDEAEVIAEARARSRELADRIRSVTLQPRADIHDL